jgi:hypothetical protein
MAITDHPGDGQSLFLQVDGPGIAPGHLPLATQPAQSPSLSAEVADLPTDGQSLLLQAPR